MQHSFAAEEMADVFSIDTSKIDNFEPPVIRTPMSGELSMQSTEIDREEARREFDLENSLAEPRANKKRRKLCSESSCTRQAQSGGRCIKHSAVENKRKWTLCSEANCPRQARTCGRCVRHGAVVKRCSEANCRRQVAYKGRCCKHSPVKPVRKLCSVDGCVSFARKQNVCTKHGAVRKLCSILNCPQLVQNRGLCQKHGATWKRYPCYVLDCPNKTQSG
jgi:hypothetical protein